MGVQKKVLRMYNIAQYEKEQEWLRYMHRNGWRFIHVNFIGLYTFEACEPEDVIYQLDFQNGSADSDYIQIFKDCGWEYVQSTMGFHYFRKPSSACEDSSGRDYEIFCDDESRLDMVKRIFRGRMIGAVVIFFGNVIPQLIVQTLTATMRNPGISASFVSIYYALFMIYIILFSVFGSHFYKLEKRVKGESGRFKAKWAGITVAAILMTAAATFGFIWGMIRIF